MACPPGTGGSPGLENCCHACWSAHGHPCACTDRRGGRTPVIARRLGATRFHQDNMICSWVTEKLDRSGPAGCQLYPFGAEGWWYTAPTPGGRSILAFHTRATNVATAWMHSAQSLLEQAEKIPDLRERICFDRREPGQLQHGITAAHSALTQPAAGKAWLAVGDAALSFDPLSSQGIFATPSTPAWLLRKVCIVSYRARFRVSQNIRGS